MMIILLRYWRVLAVGGMLAAVLCWHWADKREAVKTAVTAVHAGYAAQVAVANEEARRVEQERAATVQRINDELVKSKKRAAAAAAGARDELVRLRLALDQASLHTPGDSDGAGGLDAAGTARALGECAGTAQKLAEDGDRLAAKTAALQAFISGVCVGQP